MSGRSQVAVIGGGLVGVAAAIGLAQQGFAVTLIDRHHPTIQRGVLGMDIRNVALSPASQKLLNQLGLWGDVPAAAYYRMCIWEQWGSGQVEFDAAEVGRTELGWLLEMSVLVCAGWRQIETLKDACDIEILLGSISAVTTSADRVDLHIEGQAPRGFDFVIAADGAQSVVRQALQLPLVEQAMDQVAIATVVRTQHSHEHTAWQRFLTDGPLAFLPGWDEHLCSVVWSQSQTQAQVRMQLSDSEFCGAIEHAIEARLGAVTAVDKRMTFPLTQQRVKNCAPHRRVLLVGDAQRVVHPLAGQGVNLGLEDIAGVLEVSARQADLGAPGIWARYARNRQIRSALMIQTMASLRRIYASDSPGLSLLRHVGVQTFNAMGGLKRQVMREAMGLGRLN